MSSIADSELFGRVRRALDGDARVGSSNLIHFTVEKGVVDLWGEVSSQGEKAAAEAIAREQQGIREVINSLTVAIPTPPSLDETQDQLKAVAAALANRLGHGAKDIGVASVQSGVVRLVGHAYAAAEERAAIEAASAVPGVRDVISEVVIGQVSPAEAVEVFDDASLRGMVNSAIAHRGVTIYGEGAVLDRGIVRLRGRVTGSQDREVAEEAAAAVRGVQDVVNELFLDHMVTSTDPDEALAARVTQAFQQDGRISPADVHVEATGGIVRLFGQVDSIDDQNLAAVIARTVTGVKRVVNDTLILDRSSFSSSDKGQLRER